MSETPRAIDYLASFGISATTVETSTEWGVEMTATMMGEEITKIFAWRNREEAENDAAYRRTLSFVKAARVVCREVTTTPWEESMSDYTEHLISMAGGDGEPDLEQIQARWDAAQKTLANDQNIVSIMQLHRLNESANDVPALLALVREQGAQLEGLRTDMQDAMADAWDEGVTAGLGWDENRGKDFDTPNPYRAALTATEGKQ